MRTRFPGPDRIGHIIAAVGVPAASVWAIASGEANQWTWLSLVSVLWYVRNDGVYADALKAVASALAARFSSEDGSK